MHSENPDNNANNNADKPLKTRLAQASRQAREGDLDSAIVTLKHILESHPRHAISLGMLASIYLQIGMHAQAVKHYRTLLEISPDNPLARFQLGMAELNRGDPRAALATWEPMLALEGEFMAHFHSALALIQLGRGAQARERLRDAGRHMPSSHPLYPKLVELHSQLAEPERD